MNNFHQTAIVSKKAIIEKMNNRAYSIIEDNVRIDDCNYISIRIYWGNTDIGKNNTFFPYSSIGTIPQDLKYKVKK